MPETIEFDGHIYKRRISTEGYVSYLYSTSVYRNGKGYVCNHYLLRDVWLTEYESIPPDHVVISKSGNPASTDIDDLECLLAVDYRNRCVANVQKQEFTKICNCGKEFKTTNKQRTRCDGQKCPFDMKRCKIKRDNEFVSKSQIYQRSCPFCGVEFETTCKFKIYCCYKHGRNMWHFKQLNKTSLSSFNPQTKSDCVGKNIPYVYNVVE